MKKFKMSKTWRVATQMLLSLLGVLTGGAVMATGVEITSQPEAPEVLNPITTGETAEGGKFAHPEQSITSTEMAGAEKIYEDEYDEVVVKVRPFRTPIDTISRQARMSRKVGKMDFEYPTIDYMDDSTTLKTAYTEANHTGVNGVETAELTCTNNYIFNSRDTILVRGVKGYKEDGTTQSDDELMLWVVSRDKNSKITVIAVNGKISGNATGIVPGIAKDTQLIRMGKACTELDIEAPGYALYPKWNAQNCQKFICSVEESTYDAMTKKKVDINLSDQEEASIAMMRLDIEKSYLFGHKSKFLEPTQNRNVWTTGGIWYMPERDIAYGANYWTLGTLIDLSKTVFTGAAAGKSFRRLWICGSGLLATLEKVFVNANTYVNKVKSYNLEFTEFRTNFGSFLIILDEIFDKTGHTNDGLILDPEFMGRRYFEKFNTSSIDYKEQGKRDSKGRVMREASSLILKSPKNHFRVVYDSSLDIEP